MITILLTLACDAPEKEGTEEALEFIDPAVKGHYGVVTEERTVSSRDGLALPLQIWYPSQAPSEELHIYGDLKEGGAADSGLIDCSKKRPVAMFSHGNQGMRYQSYFLTEYLASHGYIVLAPDHVGNTFSDNDEARKPELIVRRPQDISDSFNWLLEQEKYQDCIDPDAGFAIIGHSFGGYTALSISGAYIDTEKTAEFCADYPGSWLCEEVAILAEQEGTGVYDQTDERVWATIALTPAAIETLIGGIDKINTPTIIFAGEYDTLTPAETVVRGIYEALTQEEKYWAQLQKAGHYTFSNACDILNSYPDCQDDHIAPAEAHQLINTTITAFLENERGRPGMSDYLPVNDERLIWE